MEENKKVAEVITTQPEVVTTAPASSTPKKSKLPFILLGIVFLVLCIIVSVLGLLLWMGIEAKKQRDAGNNPPNAADDSNIGSGTDSTPPASEGDDEDSEEIEVEYTNKFLGSNAEWAPSAVTITEPEALYFEYPQEYGDVTVTANSECESFHNGKKQVQVDFDNWNGMISLYTCGLGGGGYDLVATHEATTANGLELEVNVYEYFTPEDVYLVDAHKEGTELYVWAELPKVGFEANLADFIRMLESIDY